MNQRSVCAIRQIDLNHIKSWLKRSRVGTEPLLRCKNKPSLLGKVNCFTCRPIACIPSQFDLNKRENPIFLRNNVQLSETCAEVACHHFIPMLGQIFSGKAFALLPACHGFASGCFS